MLRAAWCFGPPTPTATGRSSKSVNRAVSTSAFHRGVGRWDRRPSRASSGTPSRCSAVAATSMNHPTSRVGSGRRELGERRGSSRGRKAPSSTTRTWRSPTTSASAPAAIACSALLRSEGKSCACHVCQWHGGGDCSASLVIMFKNLVAPVPFSVPALSLAYPWS